MVCKHGGVGKISRHYGSGHGSVLCQTLFSRFFLAFYGMGGIICTLKSFKGLLYAKLYYDMNSFKGITAWD